MVCSVRAVGFACAQVSSLLSTVRKTFPKSLPQAELFVRMAAEPARELFEVLFLLISAAIASDLHLTSIVHVNAAFA